jgi:hypothetical protein
VNNSKEDKNEKTLKPKRSNHTCHKSVKEFHKMKSIRQLENETQEIINQANETNHAKAHHSS